MPTELRFVPAHLPRLLIWSAAQDLPLLQPLATSGPVLVGVLAMAARRHRVAVHAFHWTPTRLAVLVTPQNAADLRRFTEFVGREVSLRIVQLGVWSGAAWKRRHEVEQLTDEEAAQTACFVEQLRMGLGAPSANCVEALRNGVAVEGIWRDGRAVHDEFRRCGDRELAEARGTRPAPLSLELLPCWRSLAGDEAQRRTAALVLEAIEAGPSDDGPHNDPVETRFPTAPGAAQEGESSDDPAEATVASLCIRAATATAAAALRDRYRAFVQAFRRAADRLRRGILPPRFPPRGYTPNYGFAT